MNPPSLSLVLDASGPTTWVGLLDREASWHATSSFDPALESLFIQAEQLLLTHQLRIADLKSFVLCDGPGSVLGLRLCAMAILTWQQLQPAPAPVFQFHSLSLAARSISSQQESPSDFWVITDWKKTAWKGVRSHDSNRIHNLPTKNIETITTPVHYFPQRKQWVPLPIDHKTIPYPFESLPNVWSFPGFLTQNPTPLLPDEGKKEYVKWSGQPHRKT